MSDKIKVVIKVRPLIDREKSDGLVSQWDIHNDTIFQKRDDGKMEYFSFDHVFDAGTKNYEVFNTIARPIVDSSVGGFNGTIFAYGQTSSGKTYTMMGSQNEPGIIPLTIDYIFDSLNQVEGREFLLRASYIEIYNERINDLLEKGKCGLKLREVDGNVIISDLKEEVVHTPAKILQLIKRGENIRRIGETNMNERSSRSHTIFRIIIESCMPNEGEGGVVQVSHLNLVDLAGSERVDQSGSKGERLKEGCSINRSLFMLSHVIKQLSEAQDQYVNFRDSKLTRILQSSLGGNAHTAIICAVTPAAGEETGSTLGFASRATHIKNKPHINEVLSDSALLKRYARQITKLQTELEKTKNRNRIDEVEEMESKLQEQQTRNNLLQKRIDLLKEKLIGSAATNSIAMDKRRALRRQTWCGQVSQKSLFQISPPFQTIHEEPSRLSSVIEQECKSSTIKDAFFETPLEQFELELMDSEGILSQDSMELPECPPCNVTVRKSRKRHVTFEENNSLLIKRLEISNSDDNMLLKKVEALEHAILSEKNRTQDVMTKQASLEEDLVALFIRNAKLEGEVLLSKETHSLLSKEKQHCSEITINLKKVSEDLENLRVQKLVWDSEKQELQDKLATKENELSLERNLRLKLEKDMSNFEELKQEKDQLQISYSQVLQNYKSIKRVLKPVPDFMDSNSISASRSEPSVGKSVQNSKLKSQLDESLQEKTNLTDHITELREKISKLSSEKVNLIKYVETLVADKDNLNASACVKCREVEDLKRQLDACLHSYMAADCKRMQESIRVPDRTEEESGTVLSEIKKLKEEFKICLEEQLSVDNESEQLATQIRGLKDMLGRICVDNESLEKSKEVLEEEQIPDSRVKELEAEVENLRERDKLLFHKSEGASCDVIKLRALCRTFEADLEQRPSVPKSSVATITDVSGCCQCKELAEKLLIVERNNRIGNLELQIKAEEYPYREKVKELENNVSFYKSKEDQLMKMRIKIHELEKKNELLKKLCGERRRRILELEGMVKPCLKLKDRKEEHDSESREIQEVKRQNLNTYGLASHSSGPSREVESMQSYSKGCSSGRVRVLAGNKENSLGSNESLQRLRRNVCKGNYNYNLRRPLN